MNSNMEERFAIRSVLLVVLAFFCEPSQQRPQCLTPANCVDNALDLGGDHQRSFNSLYLSAVEDPTAMKQLLETLLMQHNEFADANAFGIEDEENSTERPPTGTNFVDVENQSENASTSSIKTDAENSTERPPIASSFSDAGNEVQNTSSVKDKNAISSKVDEEENSTERPPSIIEDNLMEVESSESKKTITTDTEDDESFWELTTVVPQQVASPLDIHEFHFETTTIPPPPIQLENSPGQVDVTTQAPVNSTKKFSTSSYLPPAKANKISYLGNIPPSRANNKTITKRTTTKRPHVILGPQQLDSFTKTPETPPLSGNQAKIKRISTTKPDDQINSLVPVVVDRDQDIRGEIQLEILNRPISTRKPSATTASPVGDATSRRPNKKPINIIPESIVKKKGQRPTSAGVGKPQGSENRNPTQAVAPAAAAASSEPDDYLTSISALASLAGDVVENGADDDGDDEEDDEEDDGDEDDEEGEEEDEENGSNESGEEEDEEEYVSGGGGGGYDDSAEANEERENFDYIDSRDASDVISRVMEEVSSLI